MDTHIGIAFITNVINIIIQVFAQGSRIDKCNSILCVDVTIAHAERHFIYISKTSVSFRPCGISCASNPFCWNPRQTFYPFQNSVGLR